MTTSSRNILQCSAPKNQSRIAFIQSLAPLLWANLLLSLNC